MTAMAPAILVVDDEPDVRRVVRTVLEADGYQITEAADGPAALTLVESVAGGRGPALVVLDIMMPGIDGIEVCRRLPTNRMKVIILSAKTDPETKDAAIAAGAHAFLEKPFSAIALLDSVRDLLAAT